MEHPSAILVVDRFPALRVQLLALLEELSKDEWERPTAAPGWSVKDVAAHLLGGDIGILSRHQDGYLPAGPPIENYRQLVDLVNRLNAEWVVAARRMSPRVVRDLLAVTGPRVEAYFASLDPMALGGPVSWAGPEAAPVWFDLAREFTERWHHQQQIRDAVARTPLYDPYFLAPVLATFVRALPYSFRLGQAERGTTVRFEISGDAGGVWFIHRAEDAWMLELGSPAAPAAEVVLPQEIAWRLFTKGIARDRARAQAVVRGDPDLAAPIFAATAIIA
jgi:uncharacterized protein (TIGR03083 family)